VRQILLPTDGSTESEKPLAIALQLARAQDAELVLLRVIELSTKQLISELNPADAETSGIASVRRYEHFQQALEQGAERALTRLAQRAKAEQVEVRTETRRGAPAAELVDYIAQTQPDLVVMASHGRTGLVRFALGSVADRIVRESNVPVLVTRTSTDPSTNVARGIVMLDGSGLAEQALSVVSMLATKPLRHVTLYRTVRDPADREPAQRYLEAVAARLAATGIQASTNVEVGELRSNIKRAANSTDLVILCTHGRGGLDRLRHGSVAEYVVREVDAPVLLVRAGGATAVQ
jgi:nucleotide-binding universal stress UspA family protein